MRMTDGIARVSSLETAALGFMALILIGPLAGEPAVPRWFVIAVAGTAAAAIIRHSRVSVALAEDQLLLKGFWRSRAIALNRIVGLEPETGHFGYLRLILDDGSRIWIQAAPPTGPRRERIREELKRAARI